MKDFIFRKLLLSTLLLLILLITCSSQTKISDNLKLTLKTSKSTYKLGETIFFTFELKNLSDEPITFPSTFYVTEGYLHLKVSKESEDLYVGANDSGWGTLDLASPLTTIQPNKSISSKGNILWSRKSENFSGFRFKDAAIYKFKTNFSFTLNEGKDLIEIESEPILVKLNAPVREDLIVWNKIKDDSNIAYLFQYGDIRIPNYKSEERKEFIEKLNQIIIFHPNSFYSEKLQNGLKMYKKNLKKRNEMYNKSITP